MEPFRPIEMQHIPLKCSNSNCPNSDSILEPFRPIEVQHIVLKCSSNSDKFMFWSSYNQDLILTDLMFFYWKIVQRNVYVLTFNIWVTGDVFSGIPYDRFFAEKLVLIHGKSNFRIHLVYYIITFSYISYLQYIS